MVNTKFELTGKSFFSNVSKANKDGKYGVGVLSPIVKVDSKAKEPEKVISLINSFIRKNNVNNIDTLQIRNSRYPLLVINEKKEKIENAYIKNDMLICVRGSVKYDEKRNKYFLVVDGVKALEELKNYNPFDNDIEFVGDSNG